MFIVRTLVLSIIMVTYVAKKLEKIYHRLGISPSEIKEFCQKWKIKELAVFGSITRDDFNSESDIDLLITFFDHANIGFWKLDDLQTELETKVNRSVDIISKKAVEKSHNPIRRYNILANAQIIYVQR